MAARIHPAWDAETRLKIKTTQIINQLQAFILGGTDSNGTVVTLTPAQVNAATTLLKKSLPDLSAVTLTGADGGDVRVTSRIERVILDSPPN
jgi:hypothetical protein